MMDLLLATFLTSPRGAAALDEAAALQEANVPAVSALTTLQKRYSGEEARIAWSTAQVRSRNLDKLGDDARFLLDQEGAEMASGAVTSRYHADLLTSAGAAHVLDVCAGLGLDTIAFARRGLRVTSYEQDPGRALLLEENVRLSGTEALVKVVCGDVTAAALPSADAVYFDPARRSGARRWADRADQTAPPLSFVDHVRSAGYSNILAKLSPAIDRDIAERFTGSLEFVSVRGENKEALLRLGALRSAYGVSAVQLPGGQCFVGGTVPALLEETGAFIWEPDPAVVRAGLTCSLAAAHGGWQCDPHIDYFFTHAPVSTPFAVGYKVKNKLLYSRKRLQEALGGSGKVILKQRGFPQSIEEVRGKLKLSGDSTATVILTTFNKVNFAFIVERLPRVDREFP